MIDKIKIFIAILLVGCAVSGAGAQGSVVFSAKLDSTILLMGKQTALHLEVSQDKDAVGYLVEDRAGVLTDFVEVVDRPEADTTDLGNNRVQINRDLIIQSFDSGVYVIPPLNYVVGADTFRTGQLTLKVLPVFVDSMTTVHDFKNIEGVPFKILDLLPPFVADYWWIYVLFIVLVAICLFVYFKWIKKGRLPLKQSKKEVPPFDEAMQMLAELKQRQLWQSGQEKEYYTALTDILRRYIFRRFGVNAVEMTSTEIVDVLRKNEETRAVNEQLGMILEIADFVKFAKVRPLPDDNEVAYQRAVNFVQETKPVEIAPDADKPDEDASDDNNKKQPNSEQKGGELNK